MQAAGPVASSVTPAGVTIYNCAYFGERMPFLPASFGRREGDSFMRVIALISLIVISCIAISFLMNGRGMSTTELASSADLDWNAFNAQLSHDWYCE